MKLSEEGDKALSVIITAYNEAGNLRVCLPEILKQDYSEYEVIVVNDGSEDNTEEVLSDFKQDRLQIITIEKNSGKKFAIQHAIKAANNEYLVFTDADCLPNSKNWLSIISKLFDDRHKEIVLGYGRFYKRKSFLNKLIRFEGLLNAIQYFSLAIAGKAYMGVGRNLAYTKTLFDRSTAFEKHNDLKGGDDDLIINEQASLTNVALAVIPESHTLTEAKKSWIEYFHQKRRQLEVGERYQMKDRLSLMFFGLSNFLFYVTFFLLIVFQPFSYTLLTMFILKILLQFFTFKKIMTNLGDKDLLTWIPLLEFVYIIQISFIGVSTWLWKVNRWR